MSALIILIGGQFAVNDATLGESALNVPPVLTQTVLTLPAAGLPTHLVVTSANSSESVATTSIPASLVQWFSGVSQVLITMAALLRLYKYVDGR